MNVTNPSRSVLLILLFSLIAQSIPHAIVQEDGTQQKRRTFHQVEINGKQPTNPKQKPHRRRRNQDDSGDYYKDDSTKDFPDCVSHFPRRGDRRFLYEDRDSSSSSEDSSEDNDDDNNNHTHHHGHFNGGVGDCSTYAIGHPSGNHDHCDTDYDWFHTNLTATDACVECGHCIGVPTAPTIYTECPMEEDINFVPYTLLCLNQDDDNEEFICGYGNKTCCNGETSEPTIICECVNGFFECQQKDTSTTTEVCSLEDCDDCRILTSESFLGPTNEGCETYSIQHESGNYYFCDSDVDDTLNITASEACTECDMCKTPSVTTTTMKRINDDAAANENSNSDPQQLYNKQLPTQLQRLDNYIISSCPAENYPCEDTIRGCDYRTCEGNITCNYGMTTCCGTLEPYPQMVCECIDGSFICSVPQHACVYHGCT